MYAKQYKDGSEPFAISEHEAFGYLEEAFGTDGAEAAIVSEGDWNCGVFYVLVRE